MGVISEADVAAGRSQIIAPDGFLEQAVAGERARRQRR